MRKHVMTVVATMAMTMAAAGTAFAGQWQQDATGWKWQENDGSYATSRSRWIDGNADGIAENYGFDETGHCYINAKDAYGNAYDSNGARIENGVVQTQIICKQTPYDKDANTPVIPAINKTENGYSIDNMDVAYIASEAPIEDMGSYYKISDILLFNEDCTMVARLGNQYKLNIAKNAKLYEYMGIMSQNTAQGFYEANDCHNLTPGSGMSCDYPVFICPGDYDASSNMMTSLMIDLMFF